MSNFTEKSVHLNDNVQLLRTQVAATNAAVERVVDLNPKVAQLASKILRAPREWTESIYPVLCATNDVAVGDMLDDALLAAVKDVLDILAVGEIVNQAAGV